MSGFAEDCRAHAARIAAETDPRARQRRCRAALAFGVRAQAGAAGLSDADLRAVVDLLALAAARSRGMVPTGTIAAGLARLRMERIGLTAAPILRASRGRRTGTDAGALSLGPREAFAGDWSFAAMLDEINAGRRFELGLGGDGGVSVALRLLDGPEPFLEPKEYGKLVEASPLFRLIVEAEAVWFGPAEAPSRGATIPVEPGEWRGQIVSLRSGQGLRHVASLFRDDRPVEPFAQLPEMREF